MSCCSVKRLCAQAAAAAVADVTEIPTSFKQECARTTDTNDVCHNICVSRCCPNLAPGGGQIIPDRHVCKISSGVFTDTNLVPFNSSDNTGTRVVFQPQPGNPNPSFSVALPGATLPPWVGAWKKVGKASTLGATVQVSTAGIVVPPGYWPEMVIVLTSPELVEWGANGAAVGTAVAFATLGDSPTFDRASGSVNFSSEATILLHPGSSLTGGNNVWTIYLDGTFRFILLLT